MKKRLLLLWLAGCLSTTLFAQKKYEANWASIDSRPVPGWFEDAKFGIFIHWGLFSVPAFGPTARDGVGIYDRYAEWYWKKWSDPTAKSYPVFQKFHERVYGPNVKYPDFVEGFKAELFNPDEWAKVFEQSGAKYVVLTSKHHEGFTLWPSAQSWNWNAVDVGPHRDLAGDLIKSVKDKGLRMGYYYSLYEWFNPLYKENVNRYVDEHMIPQLKDLVTRYKPDIVWTDGEWDHPSDVWKSTEFLAWLYNESPVKEEVVVNDRWGKETRAKHGGFFTTEYELVHSDNSESMKFSRPWEECRGIGSSFGYNRVELLEDYSSSADVIHILIEKVSRGGNLLLNIGPTADGRIPVIMQQRLKDMGDWMKVNSEAIYGTRAWDKAPAFKKGNKLFFTRKGNDLYAIATEWTDQLVMDGISPKKVTLLGYNGTIKATGKGGKWTITAPAVTPSTIPCQYAWVYKLEAAVK
ncbi:alpha-L-fucosidase [Siphonobacter aquaeclarae]|uniref:alpha-L-fucosidase n=1 Tax=Siphonobacter aquaeclarae TaxID=563176 RepID=A0A1G9MKY9_9BACT|nr:alpha-L-fucosidase [Siphonobacter aquaeclarae]SDL74940.1 alpha-L-fucosidase [Siphonobacter aquaeclarae]